MYRILCLTNGQHIRIQASLLSASFTTKMPANIRKAISSNLTELNNKWYSEPNSWDYIQFETEEAAKWFISHRLVYNPRRKDYAKINFMENLFKFNDIPGWETLKIEFEVVQV